MTDLADPGAMAAVSDENRERAVAYMTRRGYADLLPILGLDGPERAGAVAVECPTCSRPVGSKCRATAGGGPIAKPHVTRRLAADEHERLAQAEFDEERATP